MKRILNTYLAAGSHSANWLGFFRIAVAAFALIHFLSIQADFDTLFSYKGLVQPDILNAMNRGFVPTILDIQLAAGKMIPGITYDQVLMFFRIAYILSLLALCTRFLTRGSAVCALLSQLILINTISFYQYGADSFTSILLFYCVVFPVGKIWSVDNMLFSKRAAPDNNTVMIFLRLAQWHLCIVYFIGGLDKVVGENWRNGEAFWKAITSHNMYHVVDASFLKNTPFFFIAGWGTVLVELLYPVFVNIRKTRKLWLALTIGMHLGIALFLGLFFFATIMIIFNLSVFALPYLKEPAVATPAHRLSSIKPFSWWKRRVSPDNLTISA